jgi:hypothetical protein
VSTFISSIREPGILALLRDSVARKRRETLENCTWRLHYDNAQPHIALSAVECLSKHNIPVASHPPFSVDFPCDIFMLPKLKAERKGRKSYNKDGVIENTTTEQAAIRKLSSRRLQKRKESDNHYILPQPDNSEPDDLQQRERT